MQGLLQLGHSKDHRPDLRQLKLALASLDPLGMPLATEVLSGEQADDPGVAVSMHPVAPGSLSSVYGTSPYGLRVVSLTLPAWLCMIHSNTAFHLLSAAF